MDINKLYDVISNHLLKAAINKFESKEAYLNWNQKIYEKQGSNAYGLKTPEINEIIKNYIKKFKFLSFDERIELSRKFYKADYSAQSGFGLKLLEISILQIKPINFEILDEFLGYITNWGATDSFSLYIMQPLLRRYPNEVKTLLEKWNNSDYIWKKRTSVVTFTRKIGAEGNFIDFLLKLCDNLIWDKEDLIRKAVGWALKDNMIGK
ncbi:MAG: DNA alkylation repair protein, partial [Promethearchaeota archaeon]